MSPSQSYTPLLESKFNPAISAAQLIERARLDVPETFLEAKATVAGISAPAGYGKSTILATWQKTLVEHGIRTAWLSLDENDNDPARFMRYLGGALSRALEAESKSWSPDLNSEDQRLITLERLAAQLATLDVRVCLFLDDIHVLENKSVLDTVHWLAHYAPEQLQLVLAGRSLAALPLSRLRVRRKLVELSENELKFTADEARAFFASRDIADLSDANLHMLMVRTEGWPAGLELAGILLENASNPRSLIEEFTGNEQNVMEYLGEVLLEQLDQDTRAFLFATAQFRRINADLAQQVTGLVNAQQRLDELHRGNFFLSRMDGEGRWFRYHQLIRDFLCERGQQDDPQQARDTLIRGAHHFYSQDLHYEAIQCAMRAEAWDIAGAWLAQHVEDLVLRRGYLQSIMDWMQRLPQEWADRYPTIRINYAFALTFFGRHQETEAQIQQLEALRDRLAQADDPKHAVIDELDCAIVGQRSYLYALMDDREGALRESRNWLERWPDAPADQRGGISNVLTFAYKCFGELDTAMAVSNDVMRWVPTKTEGYYVFSWFYCIRCYLLLKRGEFHAARQTAIEALETLERRAGRADWLNSSYLHGVLAMVYYEFGEMPKAEAHLEMGLSEDDNYIQADHHIVRYLTQARFQRWRGDTRQGLAILQQGRAISERLNLPRPAMSLVAEEITWYARDGQLDKARELTARYHLDVMPEGANIDLRVEKSYRTVARCQLQESPEEIANMLATGIEHCVAKGLPHRQLELMMLQAMALQQAGDVDRAVQVVTEALMVAAPRGYYRVFRDEGEPIAALLARVKLNDQQQAAAALLKRLQDDTAQKERARSPDGNTGLVEPLTQRELQILGRLQSDLSNREIAEAIFVSEGTLKWHLHNIYGKLGVRTRSGALATAKDLGLV